MKRIALALALALPAPAAAQEAGWRYIGSNTNGSAYYLREQDFQSGHSAVRNGRMWVKTDDSKNGRVEWQSSVTLFRADCVAETYQQVSLTVYYGGGRLDSISTPGEVIYAIPDSIMHSVLEAYCADPTPRRSSGERISRT